MTLEQSESIHSLRLSSRKISQFLSEWQKFRRFITNLSRNSCWLIIHEAIIIIYKNNQSIFVTRHHKKNMNWNKTESFRAIKTDATRALLSYELVRLYVLLALHEYSVAWSRSHALTQQQISDLFHSPFYFIGEIIY